jgi:WD40 repeat protein
MKSKHYEGSFCAFLFIAFLSITPFSHAAQPPKEPIIRVEAGMHTARITDIATDQENRYLVTASLDKTVRLWDASIGKLIRVLRPPIEDGDEGRLYAVAISPDGQTIACGGTTGRSWQAGSRYFFDTFVNTSVLTLSNSCIYLFDTQTGRLKKRIIIPPGTISHLTYSNDNRYLFAEIRNASITLDKKERGIVTDTMEITLLNVYRTSDYSHILMSGKGKGYCSDIFTQNNKKGTIIDIVTTSEDASIGLGEINPDSFFATSMVRKAMIKSPGETRPHSARFSPDGSMIAVSYRDSHKVDVYSAKDLSYLYSPDTTGIGEGSLMALSWSPDGRFLYAGGTCQINGTYIIRKWHDAGKGKNEDLPVSTTPITQFLSLKDGRIVFASAEPSMSIIDQDGNRIVHQRSAIANYRVKNGELLVSKDGTTIQFDYDDGGKTTSRFSINKRSHFQTDASEKSTAALQKPIQSTAGIVIKDWRNSKEPKIELMDYRMNPPRRRNQELSIGSDEISHNLAIAPDESAFILGTTRFLRLYDSRGNLKWKISAPDDPCAVNISGDSRIAVASFADGIIRWYRMEDGQELLSLFPHRDKKRWAIWTASGYFDVTEGISQMIGWHINQGKDKEAAFYPIARFFEQFYKPEMIDAVAMTLSPDRTLIAKLGIREKVNLKTDLKLPPSVEIVSPKAGDTLDKRTIDVKIIARDMGGGIEEVRLFHNGKILSADEKVILVDSKTKVAEKIFTIRMLDGTNRFTAQAISRDQVEGNPSEIFVKCKIPIEVAKKPETKPPVDMTPKALAKAEPKPVAEIKKEELSKPEPKPEKKPEQAPVAEVIPKVVVKAEPIPEIKRPPRVTILTPKDGELFGEENIEIRVAAEDTGSGVYEIRLLHNGKPLSLAQRSVTIVPRGKIFERTFAVQLAEGLNRFTASALNMDRVESAPVKITLTLKETAQETDLHIILIGINKYRNPALNLNYAVQDARSIKEFFQSTDVKRLFRKVNLYELVNEQATTGNIKSLFQDIKDKPKLQDTVVLYMAGHGDLIESDWYLIPHDVVTPENEDDVKKGGISTKYIHDVLKDFKAQKVFMVIDACKSGGMVVAMAGVRGYEDRKALIRLGRSTGTYILSASTEKQFASEVKELGHGVLTYSMLEGLKGKAGDKIITVEGLIHYVKNRLPELTEKYHGASQWPVSWGSGTDFPLVLH